MYRRPQRGGNDFWSNFDECTGLEFLRVGVLDTTIFPYAHHHHHQHPIKEWFDYNGHVTLNRMEMGPVPTIRAPQYIRGTALYKIS